MLTVDVNIATECQNLPSDDELIGWATHAYLEKIDAEVAVSVLSVSEVRRLNSEYRHKDSATNVLSFPSDTPIIDGTKHIGDIIVCAEIVEQEASKQRKPVSAHWAHMVIHSMLHLQGYDHIQPVDAEKMESLEIELLEKIGFPNPYELPENALNHAQEATL